MLDDLRINTIRLAAYDKTLLYKNLTNITT